MSQQEVFDDMFADRSLPRNIYAEIMAAAVGYGINENILNANGYAIKRDFPPYFNSVSAMETACAHFFRPLGKDVPRLRLMASQKGAPPPIIEEHMRERVIRTMIANVEFMQGAEIDRVRYTPTSVLGNEFHVRVNVPTSIRFSEFSNDNLSQHHRKAAAAFGLTALTLLKDCIHALDAYCLHSFAAWSLRPILAMPGNEESSLSALTDLRGIQNPEHYLSPSNAMAAEFFRTHGLDKHLFFPVEDPIDKLHQWHNWMDSSSMAELVFRDRDLSIALMPAGLPPQLIEPCRTSVPFYVADLIPTHSAKDQIGIYTHLNHSSFLAPTSILEKMQLPNGAEQAGRLMTIIAALATILLTPLTWGRGHRKPAWVMSPPNAHMIHHIAMVGSYAIDRLNASYEEEL